MSQISIAQVELQQRFQSAVSFEGPHSQIKIARSDLLEQLKWLKEQAGFFFLIDMSVLDFHQSELPHATRFELFIWLLNMEVHERLCVSVNFELEDLPLPSLSALYPGAEVLEREVFDMFGVTFLNRPTRRLFNPPSFQGHPLRKDFVNQNDVLSFEIPASQNSFEKLSLRDGMQNKTWFKLGPWNTMGQSMLKIEYTLKQEKIDQCLVETGYYHRGVEKICEQWEYQALFSLLNKLNHCSGEFSSLLWAEICEKSANLSLPERAQALRMVICEVARIQDHLQCLAMGAYEAQLSDMFALCMKERERLILLMQKITQRRTQHHWICVGGLSHDLTLGWMTDCLTVLQELSRSVAVVQQLCVRSRQWSEKTKVGPVRARDALDWGFSGPLLRAAGVNYDLRKASPTYFYKDVDFEIPLGINGDTYDRFLVRLEEIKQSVSIISQVIDHLPPGEVCFSADSPVDRTLAQMMGQGFDYHSIESPTGELGISLLRGLSDKPQRLKIRTSSLMAMASLEKLLPGHELDQALMTLHSLNLVHGEIDK